MPINLPSLSDMIAIAAEANDQDDAPVTAEILRMAQKRIEELEKRLALTELAQTAMVDDEAYLNAQQSIGATIAVQDRAYASRAAWLAAMKKNNVTNT